MGHVDSPESCQQYLGNISSQEKSRDRFLCYAITDRWDLTAVMTYVHFEEPVYQMTYGHMRIDYKPWNA